MDAQSNTIVILRRLLVVFVVGVVLLPVSFFQQSFPYTCYCPSGDQYLTLNASFITWIWGFYCMHPTPRWFNILVISENPCCPMDGGQYPFVAYTDMTWVFLFFLVIGALLVLFALIARYQLGCLQREKAMSAFLPFFAIWFVTWGCILTAVSIALAIMPGPGSVFTLVVSIIYIAMHGKLHPPTVTHPSIHVIPDSALRTAMQPAAASALATLKQRLAAGEITDEEYLRKKALLES